MVTPRMLTVSMLAIPLGPFVSLSRLLMNRRMISPNPSVTMAR